MADSELVRTHVRNMQIIKTALIVGVVSFAVFVVFTQQNAKEPNQILTLVTAGFALMSLFMRFVLPPVFVRQSLKSIAAGKWKPPNNQTNLPDTDEAKLLMTYQTQMIVGSALLEGGAVANLFACMTSGNIINWAMAGVLLVTLMIDFPLPFAVESWVDSKQRQLNDERRLV